MVLKISRTVDLIAVDRKYISDLLKALFLRYDKVIAM